LQNEFSKNCNLNINLLVLLEISELSKITPKLIRLSSIILIFFVFNNFIWNRLIAKSKELVSDLDTDNNNNNCPTGQTLAKMNEVKMNDRVEMTMRWKPLARSRDQRTVKS